MSEAGASWRPELIRELLFRLLGHVGENAVHCAWLMGASQRPWCQQCPFLRGFGYFPEVTTVLRGPSSS